MDSTAVIAAVPIPMVIIGPDERVAAANRAAEALLGQGIAGRHFLTVMRQPALVSAVESAMSAGGVVEGQIVTTEADRETLWRLVATPIPQGARHAVALTFEDTTPLAEAVRIRRDFVANVSHELRTPLTALISFIETLRGNARDDAAARATASSR